MVPTDLLQKRRFRSVQSLPTANQIFKNCLVTGNLGQKEAIFVVVAVHCQRQWDRYQDRALTLGTGGLIQGAQSQPTPSCRESDEDCLRNDICDVSDRGLTKTYARHTVRRVGVDGRFQPQVFKIVLHCFRRLPSEGEHHKRMRSEEAGRLDVHLG